MSGAISLFKSDKFTLFALGAVFTNAVYFILGYIDITLLILLDILVVSVYGFIKEIDRLSRPWEF